MNIAEEIRTTVLPTLREQWPIAALKIQRLLLELESVRAELELAEAVTRYWQGRQA